MEARATWRSAKQKKGGADGQLGMTQIRALSERGAIVCWDESACGSEFLMTGLVALLRLLLWPAGRCFGSINSLFGQCWAHGHGLFKAFQGGCAGCLTVLSLDFRFCLMKVPKIPSDCPSQSLLRREAEAWAAWLFAFKRRCRRT